VARRAGRIDASSVMPVPTSSADDRARARSTVDAFGQLDAERA
jgi:hypothetical protein